jgi:hypothetical protein
MASQLVQAESDLPTGPIVSNSLPIWLAQNSMAPVYPSYLVPDNIQPPYVVAHIEPQSTEALGAFPIIQVPGTPEPDSGTAPIYQFATSQLMREWVHLTLYGFTNQ